MSVNKNNSTYTKFFTRSPNLSYANPKYSIFPKPVRKSTPSPLPFTQKKQNKIFSPYNIMTKPNNKRNPFNSITTSVKSNSLNTSHINNTSLNDSSMRKFNHITTSNKLIQNRRAKTPNIPQKSSSKLNWVSLSSRASPNINTKHITKINSTNNNTLNKAKSPFTSKLNMVTNNNYQRKIQHRNFQPKNIFSKYKPKQTSTVIIASEASKMNNASITNKTVFANSNNISVPEKDNSTSSDSTNNKSKEINREISQGKIDKKISKNKKRIKCMHDLSKTGLAGDEKKVNQDNYFIFKNFNNDFENIFMGVW